MKKLTIIFYILSFVRALSGDLPEGIILTSNYDTHSYTKKIKVTYAYSNSNKLVITFEGIFMNAGATGVGSSISIKDNVVKILPYETFIKSAKVDSVKAYTLQYTIKNIAAKAYTIVHDDIQAEGMDRVATISIDLSKKTKGKIEVIPQVYYTVDLTPDDIWDYEVEKRLGPKVKDRKEKK